MNVFLGFLMALCIVGCLGGAFALALYIVRKTATKPGWVGDCSPAMAILAAFVFAWASILAVVGVFVTFAPQIFNH
jgi:hypothetical protein